MSGERPFEARIVAILPPAAAGEAAEWAAAMAAGGVDGLAVEGMPGDPLVQGLLSGLRAVTALPLELHVPAGNAAASPEGLTLDWLVPADPPTGEVEAACTAAGIGLAWPLGSALPDRPARVHATAPAANGAWKELPSEAERSLRLAPEEPPGPREGVDTLVIPGQILAGNDPGAELARWRGEAG